MLEQLSKAHKFMVMALVLVVGSGFCAPALKADIIPTQTLLHDMRGDRLKATLEQALEKADLVALLAANGVTEDDAKARVAALTDAEAQQLAAKFDQLPAGGDVTLLLVVIILILLIR